MTKIEALEKTIYNLENDVYEYDWGRFNTCNCGVLARTLLNGGYPSNNGAYSFVDELGVGMGFHGRFNDVVTYCVQTGIELPNVFFVLREAGFTHLELKKLERCGHKKHEVVDYLKAWVEILKEEKMNEVQEVKRSVATEDQSELQTLETKRKLLPPSTEFYKIIEETSDCISSEVSSF